jgi:hypothetical protein
VSTVASAVGLDRRLFFFELFEVESFFLQHESRESALQCVSINLSPPNSFSPSLSPISPISFPHPAVGAQALVLEALQQARRVEDVAAACERRPALRLRRRARAIGVVGRDLAADWALHALEHSSFVASRAKQKITAKGRTLNARYGEKSETERCRRFDSISRSE